MPGALPASSLPLCAHTRGSSLQPSKAWGGRWAEGGALLIPLGGPQADLPPGPAEALRSSRGRRRRNGDRDDRHGGDPECFTRHWLPGLGAQGTEMQEEVVGQLFPEAPWRRGQECPGGEGKPRSLLPSRGAVQVRDGPGGRRGGGGSLGIRGGRPDAQEGRTAGLALLRPEFLILILSRCAQILRRLGLRWTPERAGLGESVAPQVGAKPPIPFLWRNHSPVQSSNQLGLEKRNLRGWRSGPPGQRQC